MKIKAGDKVKVASGKDKGKTGKVLQVFPQHNRASIEGINLAIKNVRPRKQNEKGQKIEFPAPLNISNLLLVCPKCSKSVRVNFKTIEEGGKKRKKRVCNKCKELID